MSSQEAERLLKLLNDGLESGRDFLSEQAPEIVQQYILWKRVEGVVVVAVSVVATIVFAWIAKRLFRAAWAKRDQDGDPEFGRLIVSVMSGTLAFFTCLSAIVVALHYMIYWFAPKVAVTQWLVGFLK